MAVTAAIGVGTTLASGYMQSRSAGKSAKGQGQAAAQAAAEQQAFLRNREQQTAGMFGNLRQTGSQWANRGQETRGQSMAQLMGLFGGNRYAGQQFERTFNEDNPHLANVRAERDRIAADHAFRDDIATQMPNRAKWDPVFARDYNAKNQRLAELDAQIRSLEANPVSRTASYGVNAPAGGGLFDVAEENIRGINKDVLSTHDRFFNELNAFDTEGFARKELDLYRDLARPEENRQGNRMQDLLFAQGRLGTTGGSEEQGRLQEAQSQADTARVLQSIQGGRNEQGRLYDLAYSPDYRNYLGAMAGLESDRLSTMKGLFGQFYGDENAAMDRRAAFDTGVLGSQIDQFGRGTDSYLTSMNQNAAAQQQSLAQQGAASQGLWRGLGDFGGALATSSLYNSGGGDGRSRWAGIPYQRGVTQRKGLFGGWS